MIERFQARRALFQKQMRKDSVALIFSAEPAVKSNDVHYPYRQNSDFYYLTGFAEEMSLLVLTPNHSSLYLRKRDSEMETWNGGRLGIENAAQTLGLDDARDIAVFDSNLPEILKNKELLYYDFGGNPLRDQKILLAIDSLIRKRRSGETAPRTLVHASTILHEMRIIKSQEEIESIRECAEITDEAHRMAMIAAHPSVYEYELEAEIVRAFRRHNAIEGYPSIVAGGANGCVLHYTENNRRIDGGKLVLIDAGAEKNYLNADVTRTFPVSGSFSQAQKQVYEIVLAAQIAAIAEMVEESTLSHAHDRALRILVEGLKEIGILNGSVDSIIEKKEFRNYYMHLTGHWLGSDVHDVGDYFVQNEARKLKNGMVATVEPALYLPENDPAVPEEFRGIAIRIEDDVLVAGEEPDILTKMIPKTVAQIEHLMQQTER